MDRETLENFRSGMAVACVALEQLRDMAQAMADALADEEADVRSAEEGCGRVYGRGEPEEGR